MKILPFSKTYDAVTVLDFPGMELQPGQIYGVIGANGSGKSTFAKILSGVLTPDQKGQVLHGEQVGYLPQKPFAFRMSTRANLLLSCRDRKKADEQLERLQLTALANKRADRLSGGETARLALARLLMQPFSLVILDEPTAAMDRESTLLAEQLLKSYVRETGCTVILVTHSLQQAWRMAGKILYFHRGQLLESGPKEAVLMCPKKEETRTFLEFYGMEPISL